MQSQWLRSLWLAGSLLLMAGHALAQPAPPRLTEQEAGNAQFVVRWLQSHKVVDKTEVQWFFLQGMREKQRENWSAATKALSESMTRYPAPRTLAEYADTQLQMLAAQRKRDGDTQEYMHSDMARARDFYRAALAANSVLGTLSDPEKDTIQGLADCLGAYLAAGQAGRDCPPLRYYATDATAP